MGRSTREHCWCICVIILSDDGPGRGLVVYQKIVVHFYWRDP